MKTAKQIIEENIGVYVPNAGIKALAKEAYKDVDGFCIMDTCEWGASYREECIDRGLCHRPGFMLSCVCTRNSHQESIGEKAVRIYNEAMEAAK